MPVKPSCVCGGCALCKKRSQGTTYRRLHREMVNRRARMKRLLKKSSALITDQELEMRMIMYFAQKGWD